MYGLTELAREEVRGARLVANPGCYPTAAQLPLIALLKAGIILPDDIIIDAKSGTTGAGRAPKQGTLYCEVGTCGDGGPGAGQASDWALFVVFAVYRSCVKVRCLFVTGAPRSELICELDDFSCIHSSWDKYVSPPSDAHMDYPRLCAQ